MELYLVVCDRCGMEAKPRLDESAANWVAERHAAVSGHPATIRNVNTEEEVVVTGDGRSSA